MEGFMTVALLVVYFVIGIVLTERAQRHMHDPGKVYWFTPMYEPEKFTPLRQ